MYQSFSLWTYDSKYTTLGSGEVSKTLFDMRGHSRGYDEIYLVLAPHTLTFLGVDPVLISTRKFLTIPKESSLTVPYMSIL